MKAHQAIRHELVHRQSYQLEDGGYSEVQISELNSNVFKPRLVVFDEPTSLLPWCTASKIDYAINGGFTLYHREERPTQLLGNYKYNGNVLPSVPFLSPRSGIHISEEGELSLIYRGAAEFPPDGDYFQAGPMLIKDGNILIDDECDFEGVALPPLQMDDDWTRNRFPRAAIGVSDTSTYLVTCNGYAPTHEKGDQGLSLEELAGLMADLGIKDALNLDGGSKATHIAGGDIVNAPRGGYADDYNFFPNGLPILSAIVFES